LASEIFDSDDRQRSRRTAVYLRAGTELTLFVESNFAVPVSGLSQSELDRENFVALDLSSGNEEDLYTNELLENDNFSIDSGSLRFSDVYRHSP
jgi:hypothetical protein